MFDLLQKIDEREIRAAYERKYAPVWELQIATYSDLNKAESFFEQIKVFNGKPEGRLVFADIQGVAAEEGGPTRYEETDVYPQNFLKIKRENWLEVVRNLKVNHTSKPIHVPEIEQYILIRINSIKEPGADDYEKRHKDISYQLYKKAGRDLSNDLVTRLIKKYKVEINDELLAEIDVNGQYENDFLQKPLAMVNGEPFLSVNVFINELKQEINTRGSKLDIPRFKKHLINTLVSQKVIGMEADARHYEEKPPFNEIWDFYKKHRLTRALEGGLASNIKVSEDEINAFYQENKVSLGSPEKLTIAVLKGDEGIIKNIWSGVMRGEDFFEMAKKYDLDAPVITLDKQDLTMELSGVLARMTDGKISAPFHVDGGNALVKLMHRQPGYEPDLDQVRSRITESLRMEKMAEAKQKYLQELRARSEISEVNEKVWGKIRKELGTRGNENNN